MHFKGVKKSIKRSSFVISSCFKDSAFTAVKKGIAVFPINLIGPGVMQYG